MDYTTLGSTGLRVSVAGLGCGGNSRIGLGAGLSDAESVALVREAYDLGVTFFDTAEAYGTEHILGQAFAPYERGKVVISTKSQIRRGGELISAADLIANLDASLARLKTDHVDVFLLHGVPPADYEHCLAVYAPALRREVEKGKVRFLGLSETSPRDPEQKMLQRALKDGVWRVYMLAYHMLNQGARRNLFPATKAKGIGTLLMFVVRNIFSRPGLLQETVAKLIADGKLSGNGIDAKDPLGFLLEKHGAENLTDAAYRFARHEAGTDVVLFGTGSRAHLRANIASILRPPLPAADVQKLYDLFGALRGVGLDLPDRVK